MQSLSSIPQMRLACSALTRRHDRGVLSLVPTMGALHEGHRSLVQAARQASDVVAVSIFVNPMQFGPQEDFAQYPRSFEQDLAMLEREGVDLVFSPAAVEMYPAAAETFVDVPRIGARLDGASRPGHFRGVATVVSKLFHIVQPDRAYFGQKDAAQVAVLRAMVRDLNLPVELIVCPTVRDPDGLALSSRNRYLTGPERTRALVLSQSLSAVQRAVDDGERGVDELRVLLHASLAQVDVRVDYAELVDPDTLERVVDLSRGVLVAIAAWVGKTRLIDNHLLAAHPEQP